MRNLNFTLGIITIVAALALSPRPIRTQEPASRSRTPVQMVVTVEARHGAGVPVINREDVMVYEGRERDLVTGWDALQGERSRLDLYMLIDDASSTDLGSQLDDLRGFINTQPASTSIGVGYMRNGTVVILEKPSPDHARAAHALRLPLGDPGASASPYLSVADLVKRWPEGAPRREVLMVSDGIDTLAGPGPVNPYLDSAIEELQRAGVIVYSIFTTGAGHYGHTFWRINWGQNFLSRFSDETGGEAYFLGNETPVSFAPYFDDISRRLKHQYFVAFIPQPEKKAGMRPVKLRTEVPNTELVSADRVYVPAAQ